MFIFSNDNNSYVAYCLSSNIWTFDGTDKKYLRSDGAIEGGDPEGDSTKSLVPKVSRISIR